MISAPPRAVFGRVYVTGAEADPQARYLFVLTVVVLLAFAAKGLVRGRIGRAWMAIRDMDIAAEIIGLRWGGTGRPLASTEGAIHGDPALR